MSIVWTFIPWKKCIEPSIFCFPLKTFASSRFTLTLTLTHQRWYEHVNWLPQYSYLRGELPEVVFLLTYSIRLSSLYFTNGRWKQQHNRFTSDRDARCLLGKWIFFTFTSAHFLSFWHGNVEKTQGDFVIIISTFKIEENWH